MKIKDLSIVGFKSFMDKFKISFPLGISAIVGPNGCGKSNIVDAIRWVMGEQSAKQLRGRNMEDVIFNGAGTSKPLGMAEVSILFENGDGSFPAEFARESEISVTRRLYRSGESEYLINSVPCRLKDIQEIFMDTGLGNRAYSIIGQGMISTIVEQRPEETRMMLEEAAGITKYRKKVAESQRKIALTKENLQRVEDILVEVQSQMRSLKRQASKARRFRSISEEIQRLELVLNANTYHELKEESGEKVKSTEDLTQEEIARSTEFSRIQARVETMNLELDEKDKEISGSREAYLNLKDKVNRKEATLESLGGEKRMLVELERRLRGEKEEIGRRLDGLEEEKSLLKEKVEELKRGRLEFEDEISMSAKRLQTKKQLFGEAKEEYERTKNKVNSGLTEELGLDKESGYLNRMIEEITDTSDRLEAEKKEGEQKTESIIRTSKIKNKAREALALGFEELGNHILHEKEKSDELNRIKKRIEMDLKMAEADFNIYQSRLSSLRSLTENFEGYKIGVRTIMKAKDLGAMSEGRIKGLVAEVIQVDPKYEQAVEAVLADRLQYIIVESQQDGKEAVDYLKARAKGRSSFIPLKDLNREKNNGSHNGLTLLRNLVSVSDSYKPLMDTLLGDATLVDDLDRAISAWRSNGRDRCLVTLEGDMVDQKGVISGGKLSHSSYGLLARKREVKELEEKVSTGQDKVEELKGQLENANFEIEEKESSLGDLVQEKFNCQDEINELDKVIFRLSQELDQLERLSGRISDDLEKRKKDRAKHHEALSRVHSELSLCKETRTREEEFLGLKEGELRECEEEFEQIRNDLAKLKMDYELSQKEERGLIREIDRIDDFSQESQERLQRIEEDISGGQSRCQELLAREEVLKEELNELQERLHRAEKAVNLAEQGRNQFQSEIREEDRRGGDLRGELEGIREKINRAKMEHSEIGFKMTNIEEMVREKFNLDLSQIYKDFLTDDFSATESRGSLEQQKQLKENLGEVNLTAIQEHEALKERHEFMTGQRDDLLSSIDALNKAIHKINRTSLEKFMTTFKAVNEKLKHVFPILFNGGVAGLKLTDETKPLESGVLVEVRPPGKKLSHMGLLSGGEKALVAMSFLFAIYLIKPSPFCLLDEVDAPLDEANIDRFNDLLKELKKYSQIIIVTHNRRSMEIVDRLYGITMETAGVSKMIAVDLQSVEAN